MAKEKIRDEKGMILGFINLHYGFTELKPYDGCFDNE